MIGGVPGRPRAKRSVAAPGSIRGARGGRTGFSMLEAMVGLVLSLLILNGCLVMLASQRKIFEAIVGRGRFTEAVRVTRAVVGREVRQGGPDGWGFGTGGDTLALRVFRGWARVCPGASHDPDALVVRRVGLRAPDPTKDSVLVEGVGGARAVALAAVTGLDEACPGPGVAERWTLSSPVGGRGGVARYFERGSLHLTDAALRYRRGRAGRQPLTSEVFHTGASGVEPHGARVWVALGMRAAGDTALAALWTWEARWGGER